MSFILERKNVMCLTDNKGCRELHFDVPAHVQQPHTRPLQAMHVVHEDVEVARGHQKRRFHECPLGAALDRRVAAVRVPACEKQRFAQQLAGASPEFSCGTYVLKCHVTDNAIAIPATVQSL